MSNHSQIDNTIASWKIYFTSISEAILCFVLTTFCMGVYLIHHDNHWVLTALMIIFYLVCFGITIWRTIKKLSMAALMLVIPIAPLLILIIVVSMLPILEKFQ
jgi:hypothetical protein